MGTYLSTPVTEKCHESGESLDCPLVKTSWGVVDMQGWRKSMEDSHIAVTDISVPKHLSDVDAKIFGVFDGHGGPEVARFVQLYLVSVLTQQSTWKHAETRDQENIMDVAQKGVGQALVETFHALDRMVDDPRRRDEIISFRQIKPQMGERLDAEWIPDETPIFKKLAGTTGLELENKQMEQESSSQEEQKDDIEKEEETTLEVEQEKSEEKREDADQEMADDDSDEAAGKQEAAEQDRDMMDGDSPEDEEDPAESGAKSSQVSSMFKKILNLGSQSGQVEGATQDVSSPKAAPDPSGPSAMLPSLVHNGRMICNLPDHAIHAGCTAIVAVITGRTLTVANAGDSRAVLCRGGGETYALSYDHKPQQEREVSRINKAGGFVNEFGRVNGNLNLSRSLGDLKYKQVPGVSPPEQIITAEPDIMQVELNSDDEFLILGCDGIWDCLTNEKAVEYVADRIDKMSPTQIGIEMLDEIISDDPRVTQGIGGDNMTIMVIDLQPEKRQSRRS